MNIRGEKTGKRIGIARFGLFIFMLCGFIGTVSAKKDEGAAVGQSLSVQPDDAVVDDRSVKQLRDETVNTALMRARDQLERLRVEKDSLSQAKSQLSSALSVAHAENEKLVSRVNALTEANRQLSSKIEHVAAPRDVPSDQRIKEAEVALRQANERLAQERLRANQAEDAMIKAQFNMNQQGQKWSEKDLEDVAFKASGNINLTTLLLEKLKTTRVELQTVRDALARAEQEAQQKTRELAEANRETAAARAQARRLQRESGSDVHAEERSGVNLDELRQQARDGEALKQRFDEELLTKVREQVEEAEKSAKERKDKEIAQATAEATAKVQELQGSLNEARTRIADFDRIKAENERLKQHADALIKQQETEKQKLMQDNERKLAEREKAKDDEIAVVRTRLQAELHAQEQKSRRLAEDVTSLQTSVAAAQRALVEKNALLATALQEKANDLTQQREVYEKELARQRDAYEKELDAKKEALSRANELLEKKRTRIEATKKDRHELNKRHQEKFEKIRGERDRAQHELADLKAAQAELIQNAVSQKDARISELERANRELNLGKKALEDRIAELAAGLEKQAKEFQRAVDAEKTRADEAVAMVASLEAAVQQAEEGKRDLKAAHERVLADKEADFSRAKDVAEAALSVVAQQLTDEKASNEQLRDALRTKETQNHELIEQASQHIAALDVAQLEKDTSQKEHGRALSAKDAEKERELQEQKLTFEKTLTRQREELEARQSTVTSEMEGIRALFASREADLTRVGVSATASGEGSEHAEDGAAVSEGGPAVSSSEKPLKDKIGHLFDLLIASREGQREGLNLAALREELAKQQVEQTARKAELDALSVELERNASIRRVLLGIIAYFDICVDIAENKVRSGSLLSHELSSFRAKAMGFCYLVKNSEDPDKQKPAIARVRQDLALPPPIPPRVDPDVNKLTVAGIADAFSTIQKVLPDLNSPGVKSEYSALKRRLHL